MSVIVHRGQWTSCRGVSNPPGRLPHQGRRRCAHQVNVGRTQHRFRERIVSRREEACAGQLQSREAPAGGNVTQARWGMGTLLSVLSRQAAAVGRRNL